MTHPLGGFRQNIGTLFGKEKLEKKIEDVFIRFDMIHERDRRTDRQTDGQTDGHRMTAYAALMQHRAAIKL